MRGGFVAADEEARELMDAAAGDPARLEELVLRRETGEPLAWITGFVAFCGLQIVVHPDVYVPRWHTELVAERAAARLPEDGVAIDLCTGSGAVAATLRARRPGRAGGRHRPRPQRGRQRPRQRRRGLRGRPVRAGPGRARARPT